METKDLLRARGDRYGRFDDVARTAQLIKSNMRRGSNYYSTKSNDAIRESLDNIATKIARIVNGDASYLDNWQDIIGYAQLAINNLPVKGSNNENQ